MFDYDKWQEILDTICKNKLRTTLTLFGVFWGIFMLIVLLGSGEGLVNGVAKGYNRLASNNLFIWSEITTKPYKGMQPGRRIQLTSGDAKAVRQNIDGIEYFSPRIRVGWYRGDKNVTYKNRSGAFNINGDFPQYKNVQFMNIVSGRFINELDIHDKRKVAIIGDRAIEILFGNNKDVLGKYIHINGVNFQIVGHHKTLSTDQYWIDRDESTIFIPFTTCQHTFNEQNNVGWFALTTNPNFETTSVEEKIKLLLMQRHKVHPDDISAFGSWSGQERFNQIQGLFKGIRIFVWIVGICTLLAGVVGVSNIMLIVVNDRTKEIGIRKSLGATPQSIISLILQESLFITTAAGYVGLVFGIALIEVINILLKQFDVKVGMFVNPEINLKVAGMALLVIVIGGVIAGILPACKAATISPMAAIRYN